MYRQAIRPQTMATSKTQLVATKIMLPRCAPGLIARPRLLDRVAERVLALGLERLTPAPTQ